MATIFMFSTLFAADYTSLTTDELNALKGTISPEDRDAFKSEMQSRMQSLTPEERATYRSSNGSGNGQMLRDGTGSGNMYKGSRGMGR
jgi:hypothetical protein